MRGSKNSRWRALALILVHVLGAVHIAHWMSTGSSLSPLEPSEAMEFSKHDLVNAGFVFFGLTILSTLVLGRWFCGWACHLVALQDLCLWIMLRLGIRPKPLRSRLLAFVPALAALYMFVYPLGYRLWSGAGLGTPRVELTKTDFWATFPPWPVALVTFVVCGFGCVYFLGAKGFCTYACPYGAIFGMADRFAVGRIRVTDACEGCGHCTATCTSNVLVHLEVARHGMVVDPGCMKCMDCVSVCPKNALYFGFGKRARAPAARRGVSLAWSEEVVLAALFVLFFLVYRGLYGMVPFLLALGLAGILAFLGAELVQLLRRPNRTFLGRPLKKNGRLTGMGRAFGLVVVGALLLSAHSALIQLHSRRSAHAFESVAGLREGFLLDPARELEAGAKARTERALASARFVERFGLFTPPSSGTQGAWLSLLAGSPEGFESGVRTAIARAAEPSALHYDLARFHQARGHLDAAVDEYEASLAARPVASVFDQLARLLFEAGRGDEALAVSARAVAAFPDNADLRFNQGVIRALLDRPNEAIESFRSALALAPERRDALENLLGLLRATGREAEARELLDRVPPPTSSRDRTETGG